jgi:hypothetical protein
LGVRQQLDVPPLWGIKKEGEADALGRIARKFQRALGA